MTKDYSAYSSQYRELLENLDKVVTLEPTDLKGSEYERGFKMGQLELVQKIKQITKQKETSYGR